MMSKTFEEREIKDARLIEEVVKAAEKAADKAPELVEIRAEAGYKIIKIKDDGPGVHERKEHKPGHCLIPE